MREMVDRLGAHPLVAAACRKLRRPRGREERALSLPRPSVGRLFGLLASVLLLSFGCASQDRSVQDAIDSGPLPYHVAVYLREFRPAPEEAAGPESASEAGDAEATVSEEGTPSAIRTPSEGGGEDGPEEVEATGSVGATPQTDSAVESPPGASAGSGEQPVRFVIPPSTFLTSMADALDGEDGVVAKATPIEAQSREEAIDKARRLLCDKILILSFETDPEYREISRPAGWVTLEVVCWLFGGIPAWFVPTVHFDTHTRLVVEGIDVTSGAPPAENGGDASSEPAPGGGWRVALPCDAQGTSLWDRSDPLDRPLEYLSTIVVPPLIHVPGDPERVSAEISGEVEEELGERLVELAHQRLSSELLEPTCSAVFVSPDPREAPEGESIGIRLGIANRGPARIVAMDVSRVAKDAPVVRWQATAEDLRNLEAAIQSTEDPMGYALFDVPEEFPLRAGENFFKVRLLREDRAMTTNSACYER